MAQGDRDAFATLFRDMAPRIRGFFLRAGHREDADELTQETMLRVWRAAGRYDPAKASPATWIFTIARNLRIDRARRKRIVVVDDDPVRIAPPEAAPDELASRRQRARELRQALQDLPETQADTLRAVYFGHKSARAVAEESGVPVGTVKSRIRLGVRALRGVLDAGEDT